METILTLVAGTALLIIGGDLLVRGSSGLARRFGVPPLVVGLTVVAVGTSSPEMAVGVIASFQGNAGIATGNVIGSNIFNVLVILGLSALLRPLSVDRQLIRLDVPVMVGLSLLCWLMAVDGYISRLDGVCLLAGLGVYLAVLVRSSRRSSAPAPGAADPAGAAPGGLWPVWALVACVLGGLALLVLGSRYLVTAASDLARSAGVSELVIGLTIVAAGTSLPEVAASVIAAIKHERDLAIGNVVGSNIFNLLAVLGLSSLPPAGGIPVPGEAVRFDFPVMLAVAVLCVPVFLTGRRISRAEGAMCLGLYAIYTAWLLLEAAHHPALATIGPSLLGLAGLLVLGYLGLSLKSGLAARGRENAAGGPPNG